MPDQLAVVLHRQGCFPAVVTKQDSRPAKDAAIVRQSSLPSGMLCALIEPRLATLCHRRSFITYLRGSDAAPEVLQSAATSMKHLIDTQASDVYGA